MDLDYKSIGKRIRRFRKSKGMTQDDLGEKVDKSKTHMSHIETGNTKLSLPLLVNITNALGVSVDNLLCDSVGASSSILKDEIADITKDCSTYELKCMIDTMILVKNSIRNNPNSRGEMNG